MAYANVNVNNVKTQGYPEGTTFSNSCPLDDQFEPIDDWDEKRLYTHGEKAVFKGVPYVVTGKQACGGIVNSMSFTNPWRIYNPIRLQCPSKKTGGTVAGRRSDRLRGPKGIEF